jgi:nicotinamidase-related amidase
VHIDKHWNSSFEQTPLEETLTHLDVSHIVLAGALTNWCIRATAYAALDRGYDLTLLEDAHTTEDIELDNGETISARDIILDLNIVMTWVSYPDRTNHALSVANLNF